MCNPCVGITHLSEVHTSRRPRFNFALLTTEDVNGNTVTVLGTGHMRMSSRQGVESPVRCNRTCRPADLRWPQWSVGVVTGFSRLPLACHVWNFHDRKLLTFRTCRTLWPEKKVASRWRGIGRFGSADRSTDVTGSGFRNVSGFRLTVTPCCERNEVVTCTNTIVPTPLEHLSGRQWTARVRLILFYFIYFFLPPSSAFCVRRANLHFGTFNDRATIRNQCTCSSGAQSKDFTGR